MKTIELISIPFNFLSKLTKRAFVVDFMIAFRRYVMLSAPISGIGSCISV